MSLVPIEKRMFRLGGSNALYARPDKELYVVERGDPDRVIDPLDVEDTETLVDVFEDYLGAGDPVEQPLLSDEAGGFRYWVAAGEWDLYSPDDITDPIQPWTAGGEPGPTGAMGVPGSAPVTRVTDLVADPAAETDWGDVINTAMAAGAQHLFFNSDDTNEGDFPFNTTIEANLPGLMFEGQGGATDHYGNVAGIERMPAYLRWTGTGTTSPIECINSVGFSMRNLGVYYDSGSFTGRVIDWRGDMSLALMDRCDIGSLDHAFDSALANVHYDNAWNCEIRNSTLHGADYNILGATDGGTFCDTLTIQSCHFAKAAIAHIGGIGRDWTIDDNFFGMGLSSPIVWTTPKLLTTPSTVSTDLHSYFTFTNNSIWDAEWDEPWFYSAPENPWNALFQGNTIITVGVGPLFLLEGGGKVRIENNTNLGTGTGAMFDLGDTTGDAVALNLFTLKGNGFSCNTDAITNLEGHHYVEVQSNTDETYTRDIRTLGGQERLAWYGPTPAPAPSIVDETALGSTGSASIVGTDLAGFIQLTPGGTGITSGKQATITLSRALDSFPNGSRVTLHVTLTPIHRAGGWDGANAVNAGASVEVVDNDTDTFAIRTVNALAGATVFAYRVLTL